MNRKKKYGNLSCKCDHDHIHRSRFEAHVCNELHLEYPKEVIKTEVKFPMAICGELICNHYMDFVVYRKTGAKLAVEAKGLSTSTWKLKSKLFKALYPNYEYQIRYYKYKR